MKNGACTAFHKAHDNSDRAGHDGDCTCESEKVYGQCYEFLRGTDAADALAIAEMAQLNAITFAEAQRDHRVDRVQNVHGNVTRA